MWPRFGRFSGLPRMVGGCRLCQMLCFSMGHMFICVVRVFVVVRKSRFSLSSPLSLFFELSWFERKTRKKNFMFLADTYLCIWAESSCQGCGRLGPQQQWAAGWCGCSQDVALRQTPRKPESIAEMHALLKECHSLKRDERYDWSHNIRPGASVPEPCKCCPFAHDPSTARAEYDSRKLRRSLCGGGGLAG